MYLNRADLKKVKTKYEHAVKHNQEQFKFDGQTFVVGYAKYLIEYLESMSPEQHREYEFKYKFDYMKKASNQKFVKFGQDFYIGCESIDKKITLIAKILSDVELKKLMNEQ